MRHYLKITRVAALAVLFAAAALALPSTAAARAATDNRAPDLPSPLCDGLQAPAGNKVAFHVYAQGVQVYRWNGASWDLVAPVATLSADPNHASEVGIHYAGPTWESKSGSKVAAKRLLPCTPDASAIPWLLLQATSTSGPGVFSSVTYVQRVNTTGGLAPATPGTAVGMTAEVPYTAEYYFYRAED
jgi:hypothetical protein